jgi:two-component system cell cycle sensor histidine kinase/response regulator CckA
LEAGHIIIVEPDGTIRAMYEHTVRADGFAARGFEKVGEALEAIKEIRCEVGLLHLEQPGSSAEELLASWLNIYPDAPVIVIVSDPTPQDIRALFRAGAVDVLIQPPKPEELVFSIRSAAHRRTNHLHPTQKVRVEVASRMAVGIVHHLNNLLERIVGRTSLLMARADLAPDIYRELRDTVEDSRETAAFIRRMSYLGQSATIQFVRVFPIRILQDTLQSLAKRRGTRARFVCDFAHQVSMPAERRLLAELFEELLINAQEANPAGEQVTVTAQVEGNADITNLFIRIEDQGPGLTESQMKHLFEPFFSTKASTGRGLGLVVASGIASRLGGTLDIDNRTPHGVVATLRFPISQGETTTMEKPGEPEAAPMAGSVLLIDDMEPVLVMIGRMLSKITGLEVIPVTNGVDALALLDRPNRTFSLIVLDLSLREESGVKIYRKIRERKADVPVLFISGYTSDAGLQTALDEDRKTRFLPKPFELEQLRKAISSLNQ